MLCDFMAMDVCCTFLRGQDPLWDTMIDCCAHKQLTNRAEIYLNFIYLLYFVPTVKIIGHEHTTGIMYSRLFVSTHCILNLGSAKYNY